MGTLLYIFYAVEKQYSTSKTELNSLDGIVTIIVIVVSGAVITRLARNYGVKKTGWLGVGGKSVLVMITLTWVIVLLVYSGTLLFGPRG